VTLIRRVVLSLAAPPLGIVYSLAILQFHGEPKGKRQFSYQVWKLNTEQWQVHVVSLLG